MARSSVWWASLALVVLLTSVAKADIVTYSSQSAFLSATQNTRVINFEGLASPGGIATYGAGGLTVDGVNFTGLYDSSYYLAVVDSAFSGTLYDWDSVPDLVGLPPVYAANAQIEVTLPPGTTAVGANFMTIAPAGQEIVITLADGETFDVNTQPFPTSTTFGLTTDTPITSLSISGTANGFPALDDFTFGQEVTAVPAPGGFLLFGTGIAFLAGAWILQRIRDPWNTRSHVS